MAVCDEWALLKGFEVLLCLSCIIYKRWTDEEASRLFFLLKKLSREWPLLNNVTWNQAGSLFADVTFGGYSLITVALFIAYVSGELRNTRKTESFLLCVGVVLFLGAGLMILSSFDVVHDELVDNSIVLGLLSLLTGFVFIIDIICAHRRNDSAEKIQKQDKQYRMKKEVTIQDNKKKDIEKGNEVSEKVIGELKSSIKKKEVKEMNNTDNSKVLKEPTVTKESNNSSKPKDEITEKVEMQYGRKYLDNRGFPAPGVGKASENKGHEETDNNYDEQSIRDYKEDDQIIQSSKISTTKPQGSDSPTSDEIFELQPPPMSHLLLERRRIIPTYTASRIERLSEKGRIWSVPSSPNDPGYVLHTAAKWPHTNPVPSNGYRDWRGNKNKILHSAV